MWDVAEGKDGRVSSVPEENVWTMELPHRSFEALRTFASRPRARAFRSEGEFVFHADGSEPRSFGTLREALDAGRALHASMEESFRADAFASAGLSPDRWSLQDRTFVGVDDVGERLIPVGEGWVPMIGTTRLPHAPDAAAAQVAIDGTPHLRSTVLERLEDVYEYVFDRNHPDHVADLVAEGLVSVDGDWKAVLTEAGTAALDADPRTCPIALREIVFAEAAKLLAEAGQDGGTIDAEAARFRFNRHLRGLSEDNGRALKAIAENGLEVRVDVADTEPHEIVVKASGRLADGSTLRDQAQMLLAPDWAEDGSGILAEAIVAARDLLVAAVSPASGAPKP